MCGPSEWMCDVGMQIAWGVRTPAASSTCSCRSRPKDFVYSGIAVPARAANGLLAAPRTAKSSGRDLTSIRGAESFPTVAIEVHLTAVVTGSP